MIIKNYIIKKLRHHVKNLFQNQPATGFLKNSYSVIFREFKGKRLWSSLSLVSLRKPDIIHVKHLVFRHLCVRLVLLEIFIFNLIALGHIYQGLILPIKRKLFVIWSRWLHHHNKQLPVRIKGWKFESCKRAAGAQWTVSLTQLFQGIVYDFLAHSGLGERNTGLKGVKARFIFLQIKLIKI